MNSVPCPECGDAWASHEFSKTCNTCGNPNAFDGPKWGYCIRAAKREIELREQLAAEREKAR
jgi:hypothetical protein